MRSFKSVPAGAPKGLDILMELEIGRVVFKDNPPERKYDQTVFLSYETLPL